MEDGFQVRTFDRVSLRSPTHPTAFSDSSQRQQSETAVRGSSQRQIDVTSDRESSRVDGSVSHVWTSKEFAESSQRARRLMRAHVGSLEIIKMSSIATTAGPTTRRPRTRSPRTTSAGGFVFAVLVLCVCSVRAVFCAPRGTLRSESSCTRGEIHLRVIGRCLVQLSERGIVEARLKHVLDAVSRVNRKLSVVHQLGGIFTHH